VDGVWVEDNFDKSLVDSCKLNPLKWCHIPAGLHFRDQQGYVPMDTPVVTFQQGSHNTCLFSGAASAVAHLGGLAEAQAIAHQSTVSMDRLDRFTFLRQFVHDNLKGWTAVDVTIRPVPFDPLQAAVLEATVVLLEDTRGGRNHSVTIAGGWIFDANHQRALPLNMESLHFCVGFGRWFKRVYKVMRIIPGKKLAVR
jgi:hypothetical protein